jgi:nucleotide-binding universal stress UspA family protein
MNHILVPVDGSEGALRAARFAARIAKDSGASLTFLYVYDAPAIASMGLAQLSAVDLDRVASSMADHAFSAAKNAVHESGITPRLEIAQGNPTVEILAFSEAEKPDLIVMGSRGISAISGLVMGSVSERVLRAAPCPVTVVR